MWYPNPSLVPNCAYADPRKSDLYIDVTNYRQASVILRVQLRLGDGHPQLELLAFGVLGNGDGEQPIVIRCLDTIAIHSRW